MLHAKLRLGLVLLLLASITEVCPAQSDFGRPTLVAEINLATGSSSPLGLTAYGSLLCFAANDGVHGYELWCHDGQEARMVADINPTGEALRVRGGSLPLSGFVVFENTLYFAATDGVHGTELWSFDGSVVRMVEDLNPGGSSNPQGWTLINDALYFRASLDEHDSVMKIENKQVQLIARTGVSIDKMFAFGEELMITGSDENVGAELWRLGETAIELVADLLPGAEGSGPQVFAEYNGSVYFTTEEPDTLWRYDGSHVSAVLPFFGADEMIVYEGDLYISGNSTREFYSNNLWRYDGNTLSAPFNLNPGSRSWPSQLTVFGDKLMFSADDGHRYVELWQFDGTSAEIVEEINTRSGRDDADPHNLTVIGDTLYFAAEDDDRQIELWIYDGNELTKREINPAGSSAPALFTRHAGDVFFVADTGEAGRELLALEEGTVTVASDINSIGYGSSPSNFTRIGDELFFVAYDWLNGSELRSLWNGELSAPLDPDMSPDWVFPGPVSLTAHEGTLYFSAGGNQSGVWRVFDDSAQRLFPQPANAALVSVGEQVLFSVTNQIYGVRGADVEEIESFNGLIRDAVAFQGSFYFSAIGNDPEWYDLFRLQGSQIEGIARINPSGDVTTFGLTDGGSHLYYFTSHDDSIRTYDGTVSSSAAGPGCYWGDDQHARAVGDTFYFSCETNEFGSELWSFDGVTASLVADLLPGHLGSEPEYFASDGNRLFLAATDEKHGRELFIVDDQGLHLLADILPGRGSSEPSGLRVIDDILYFSANGGSGAELWALDLSSAPTGYAGQPHQGPASVSVYPNPVDDTANVTVAIAQRTHATLDVFDIVGRLIHSQGADLRVGDNVLMLGTGSWPVGQYFLRIRLNEAFVRTTLTVGR